VSRSRPRKLVQPGVQLRPGRTPGCSRAAASPPMGSWRRRQVCGNSAISVASLSRRSARQLPASLGGRSFFVVRVLRIGQQCGPVQRGRLLSSRPRLPAHESSGHTSGAARHSGCDRSRPWPAGEREGSAGSAMPRGRFSDMLKFHRPSRHQFLLCLRHWVVADPPFVAKCTASPLSHVP